MKLDKITKINPEETKDLYSIVEELNDTRHVLIGEASHGTSEFYLWRALITRYLIQKHKFNFIAVEADWPDCYKLNRYVKGYTDSGESAYSILHSFNRWPTWMWANWEVVAFIEWLKEYNKTKKGKDKVGFYGMDVYSLWDSLNEVMKYLKETDKERYKIAKQTYACFEPYKYNTDEYAWEAGVVKKDCQQEVTHLLMELRKKDEEHMDESEFNAKQNSLVIKNSERYYRTMLGGGPESWNVRDIHMAQIFEELVNFHGKKSKGIVWEHNTHIGDARATDMGKLGIVNVGQLLREKYPNQTHLIGFGTYQGSVIASRGWGSKMKEMIVPPAKPKSWEEFFHNEFEGSNVIIDRLQKHKMFEEEKGHRAIGVVYNPTYEWGNYVPTILNRRYDSFIYIDQTHALHPLHISPKLKEPPDTFPWGL